MTKFFKRGFTLVELSLSMVFIGILSIAVALTMNSAVKSYQRGQTLNAVNTTGMDLVDDFRSAVQNSSADTATALCIQFYPEGSTARTKCQSDNAEHFVTITKYAKVWITENSESIGEVPVWGAFCTGAYSYIWNSGYYFNSDFNLEGQDRRVGANPAMLKYRVGEGTITIGTSDQSDQDNIFRLLKIRDEERSVCTSVVRPYDVTYGASGGFRNEYKIPDNESLSNEFNISVGFRAVSEEPALLLTDGDDRDLALYDFYVAPPAESTTQDNMFYSAAFILGTTRGGINIKSNGRNCIPPEGYETEDFDYCAINKFNFAVQANGATK